MQITIIEGCRGTGKTSLAFKMRQTIPETTLINFTGFHDDNEKGLQKASDYYDNWMSLLYKMHQHESKYVFDRFYFSERVYSQLYKNYNFTEKYVDLNFKLEDLSEIGVKINIIFLTIDNEGELQQRLIRDKVPFGNAVESVKESLTQQLLYRHIFYALRINHCNDNLQVHTIDTSGKTNDEVFNEIMKSINPSQ